MSRALLTDIFRAIRHSMSRFISIIIIVALGTGFFVGMKATGPSMKSTAAEYFKANNLMDLRIQSPIGISEDDLNAVKTVDGVSGAMGEKFVDALVLVNGKPEIDIDGSQISTRAYGINLNKLQEYYYGADDPEFINRPTLLEGSYPTKANQCLVDASSLSTPESYQIGNVIELESDANTDLSGLSATQFEIVGVIESPYYISFERGNSLVGSGKIGTYIYIPDYSFTSDYYSEVYVTVDGASSYEPYSSEYYDYVDSVKRNVDAIASEHIQKRVDELSATLPAKVSEAQSLYNSTKTSVEAALKTGAETIATYQKYVDDPEGSYAEAVNKVASALGVAESEFNGNSDEYYAAVETYNANLAAYQAAKTVQAEKYSKWSTAKSDYDSLGTSLTAANATWNTTNQLVTSTQSAVDTANSVLTSLEEFQNGKMTDNQLVQVLATLQSINPDLYSAISSLSAVSMASEAISLINPYLSLQKEQLAVYQAQLKEQKTALDDYTTKYATAGAILTAAKTAYDTAQAALDQAYSQLNSFYDKLEGTKSQLSMAQIELMINENSAGSDLDLLKATIANAGAYLEKAKNEYNTKKAAAETKLAEAENQINSGKKLLAKLPTAKWNVENRIDLPGYDGYNSAVNNVDVLSNIFPVIFFLVAALVCLTTLSRMVEEERTQMGTLKALGYSNGAISSKYILYALFASISGSAIGIVIGVFSLPYAISGAYSIMFTMPKLSYAFPVSYIFIGMAISVSTTLAAAWIASEKELRVRPASLMRPKAPKPGKRVLLEHIGFIWKRMSFTGKVTTRNLFRRKTRFVVTALGIAGCTALILASSGLYSSINDIMKKQYGTDGIAQYNVQVVFSENQTDDSTLMKIMTSDARITSIMLSSMQSVTGGADSSEKTEDVYLFVPKNADELSKYVKLQNRKTGSSIKLDDTGAVITEKFADDMNVSVGDTVWAKLSDGRVVNIPVAAVTENYTFSYIYMSENLYQYLFQEAVGYNYAIGTLSDTVINNSSTNSSAPTEKSKLSSELMAYDGINAVSFVSDAVDSLNEVINVLSIIIIIFIVAAALLAFIVLYNLSNINISERQRELATIKVLGFHDKEVSAYVYRENIILTIIGIILGMVLGVFVHKILLKYCAVDTVMFVQSLTWYSFAIAAGLTALFSVFVNVIMHKHMKKIDMVESLKAVE